MPNTVEQQLAIDTIDRNVSVSAGAGSGKTAVLKQRFLHILKKSKDEVEAAKGILGNNIVYSSSTYAGVKASNIVGITFTRKAAGEIKSRIREAILETMNEGDVSFWRMQLEELERAQINTIHGLCSRILRENPVEANLDPGFVIAEDTDYEAFKEDCILKFIRKELADTEDNSVKALTDIFGASKLREYLAGLAPYFDDIAEEQDLTAAYNASIACIPDCIDELKGQLQYLADERDNIAITGKGKKAASYTYLEILGSNLLQIFADLDFGSLESVKNALSFTARDRVKEERDIAKDKLADIETRFIDKEAIPLMHHWQNLIKDLSEFLTIEKQNENMLTYDDLETKAIELLTNNDELRHKYQQKYQCFMVDEFQDTNDKQCALIYLLCGDSADVLEGNKLFVVGDPKQSIYRFRGADVDVFAHVQKEIRDSSGINISMKTNFRSKDKILDCCNETFEKIMGKGSSSVVFEPLDCADFNQDFSILPELIKIDPDASNPNKLELVAVAQKIIEVANIDKNSEAYKTGDKVYGNMAVLLRSMTHVNDLTQVLSDYNIPFVVIDGKGFYERQEIADIINLFDVMLDPYQNIPFAAILRSPYFGFDDELLTKLLLKNDYAWDALRSLKEDSWSDVNQIQHEQLLLSFRKIMHLYSCVSYMDLAEIWTEIWKTFDLEAVISMQNNGRQKLANIKKLRKLSLEYIQENNVGLAEWLEYVKNGRAMEMRETNANLDSVDAVQIMTIHKSKGLEFSKVFLPFLGAKQNSDTRAIVYSKGLGLGVQLADSKGNPIKTSVYKAIKELDKDKDREERQRLLYVAMTRAENELYMFGIPAKSEKEFDESKWFDQLWNVYSNYDGVVCSEFTDDDILQKGEVKEIQKITIEGDLKKQIDSLPDFKKSGRVLFTASALTNYLYCQRQYFYSELMGLPALKEEVVDADNVLSASVMGDIIHETLEKYQSGMDLRKLFNDIAKIHADGKNNDKAWDILYSYVQSDLYGIIPKNQLHEFEFIIETDANLQFNGFIDVIAYNDDDTINIIDYKSGKPPADGEEKTGYMYQLAIYKYAVEKLFKKTVKHAELHFLQNCSTVELEDENAFSKVVALANEISGKSREEQFTCNLESCGHCQYNYLCKKI